GMGVDGFRLDAIPYLYEREGTSCENLPETHVFLRELRQHLDATHPNRMLLSEANMWPEDAVAYFGKGDECHMNFHFPLMPRLFMALQLEDRLPIVEILKRTPDIPETCQWAMFLRNHDELTLEMVTDEERDYMYRSYASDQRARINLGIRRRLAPLLGNDRVRIEVMNALLFSMPGTPVIYYGDEIGMGDNVFLGDRNGVRTPMQWSPDRNAGFSSANPQRLYLPVNIDPAYHYETINVESQQDNPNSLLSWTKRLIALRKQYRAFGRGTLEFLSPSNQRVLAYFRRYENETILVAANLSRFAQAVQLDLRKFEGYTPVEMFGRTDFPAIGNDYYPLTLGPNSFFWFSLEHREASVITTPAAGARRQAIPTLNMASVKDIWDPAIRGSIAAVLPRLLHSRPWLQSADRRFRSIQITESIPIDTNFRLTFVRVEYSSGDPDLFLVPLGLADAKESERLINENPDFVIADIRTPTGGRAALFNALNSKEFCTALIEAFARRRKFVGESGQLVAQRNRQFRKVWGTTHPNLEPSLLPTSEVDTSIKFGDRFVLKLIRKVESGIHPGVEMGELLTEKQPFPNAAPFAGCLQYEGPEGEKTIIGLLNGYVPNEGDAWRETRKHLDEFFDRNMKTEIPVAELWASAPINIYNLDFAMAEPPPIARELIGSYLSFAETMGSRIAELHRIFSAPTNDPAFAPEPFNDFYRQGLYHGYIGLTTRRMEFIRQRIADMKEDVRVLASNVLEQEIAIVAQLQAVFEQRISSERTRFHGRLHLGHLLVTGDDVVIFDFEGDSQAHISERRIKRCPLRDVTSMLVSFGYAAQGTFRQIAPVGVNDSTRAEVRTLTRFWYSHVTAAFIRGYWNTAGEAPYLPKSRADQQTLLQTYLMERALLDVRADIADKPALAGMPLRIILHLLNAESERRLGVPEGAQ
nr:alpha-glucosidase C-terminal domain-containing protein [Acidobacteriota bacterium]